MKYAILIDAGFLKRKLGSQAEPLDVNGVCAFLNALREHEALAGMRWDYRWTDAGVYRKSTKLIQATM